MTKAQQIMDRARLQAAIEYAWETSWCAKQEHWKPGEHHYLPLVKLYPPVRIEFDTHAHVVERLPICVIMYERSLLNGRWGHRLIIKAPYIDSAFSWIAKTWETPYNNG